MTSPKEHHMVAAQADCGFHRALSEPQYESSSDNTSLKAVAASFSVPMFSSHSIWPQFTLFEKLPMELQHMIWWFALPGPRAVHFKISGTRGHGFAIASELAIAKVKVTTSIPGVLHAVRDSRAIALKHYQLAFEDHPRVQTMFFNYDHDYLHISPLLLEALFAGAAMEAVREQTLTKIRNLIIGPYCQLHHHELDVLQVKFFRSLKHVILPHRYPLGDLRRFRKENAGIQYFKHARCTKNVNLRGMDVEYKTMVQIRELSRAMRRGN
ncbi:hypothetical protein ONS95_006636 [Cadophora gregata]|uniref:uncharacterized protein n=1 Tax=Cadophora gregata TaxID=51156 RepID=UPI0026DAFAC1|nr:uncharacterized protein ONS95_006636 [Cadophora gregata]KAK0101464.1 hypothetical protein ONS95_006636 [Cadophora gregata]